VRAKQTKRTQQKLRKLRKISDAFQKKHTEALSGSFPSYLARKSLPKCTQDMGWGGGGVKPGTFGTWRGAVLLSLTGWTSGVLVVLLLAEEPDTGAWTLDTTRAWSGGTYLEHQGRTNGNLMLLQHKNNRQLLHIPVYSVKSVKVCYINLHD